MTFSKNMSRTYFKGSVFGLCASLLAGSSSCTASSETREDGTADETNAALTTPTGANWIVLPRPPARTSRMFADAFVAPFAWEGWDSTATPTTSTKTEGTSSLQINLQTAWSAFGVGVDWAEAPYSAASQTEVSFAFNAGAAVHAGVATLAVAVDDGDDTTPITYTPLKPFLTSGTVTPNTWYSVTIPIGTLNPSGRPIRRLLVANQSSLTNVGFFVDDIKMSWTDLAPTERLVYGDAAGSSFSVEGWSITNTPDSFRTTGANANKGTFTAAWGALTFVYDWNLPELAAGAYTTVSFDVSPGPGTPPAAMNSMLFGLNDDPQEPLLSFIPGGFKANTWHRVTLPLSRLTTQPFRMVTFKNESASLYSFYVDHVRFETDHAPPPLRPGTGTGDPDTFNPGEVDVVTVVRTAEDRVPISPLIYGINGSPTDAHPAALMRGVTFVRRGGDRSNAYNWETNVSNGSHYNGFASDMYLAEGLANPNAPGALDLQLLQQNRAAGRGTMVPFVLNDYVAGPIANDIPYDNAGGWNRDFFFRRVRIVKPTAFSSTPDLLDGVVYTDEHINFLKGRFTEDIFAPGPSQLMVGTDNEPDLFAFNFPMLQVGSGEKLYADNGVHIGNRVTGPEFTQKFLTFAKRVKGLWPNAPIVGPDHYHFDGWTTWHDSMHEYSGLGRWYMDDFLLAVKNESATQGKRLLDTWDFHWYPQRVFNGVFTWDLDHASRPMTQTEIDAVVQGPRSYWDTTYDEQSWITNDHLLGPAYILKRLHDRLATGYPGTKLGVTEYYPGGRHHISSGLATADSLGVFGRMGIHVAAMWPAPNGNEYAFGGIRLLRNADGADLRFADTSVKVEHPERQQSSVYAGSDGAQRVTVLVINKTSATRKFGLRAFHSAELAHVDVYRIDAANPNPRLATSEALSRRNAYAYSAPPMSAAMLVFRAR